MCLDEQAMSRTVWRAIERQGLASHVSHKYGIFKYGIFKEVQSERKENRAIKGMVHLSELHHGSARRCHEG